MDRELLQRARTAASALPDTDRASAALLLRELQAQHLASLRQRHLPFSRPVAAIAHMLQHDYHGALQSQALPHPLVAMHWLKPAVMDMHARPALLLDATMVARWAHALQAA